jgi:hypothetical protein
MASKAQRIADIKHKLQTNDRWLVVGLLTIYAHQTAHEQSARNTEESNGVGFNGPDGATLTSTCQFILRRTSLAAVRTNPNFKLEDVLDKAWAIENVRKRMPKYASQLERLASAKAGK